jgi:hypothetical protein
MASRFSTNDVLDFVDNDAFGLSEGGSSSDGGEEAFTYLGGAVSNLEELSRAVCSADESGDESEGCELSSGQAIGTSHFQVMPPSGVEEMEVDIPGENKHKGGKQG